jgi:hypothetical protein
MKNTVLFAAFALVLFTMACKKDEALVPGPGTTPAAQSVKEYYPLTQGSYWTYKQTQYDTSGNMLPQTWPNDSVVVENDTLINGVTFHTVVEYNFLGMTMPMPRCFRDSADCIVNEQGKIIFSIKEPGLIIKDILTPDTLAYVNYYYNSTPMSITVPLGVYSCTDFRGEVFRKLDNFSKAYLTHKYSYKNVGPVKKTVMYVGALTQTHFDLVAYHIQ